MVPNEATDNDLLADVDRIERSFFQSVGYLTDLYGIDANTVLSDAPYPTWIVQTYDRLVDLIQVRSQGKTHLVITALDSGVPGGVSLTTVQEYNSNDTLYWIPLQPYDYLLRTGDRRERLVGTILHYLYFVARIPGCTDRDGSWMADEYGSMADMYEDMYDESGEDARQEGIARIKAYETQADACIDHIRPRSRLLTWDRQLRQARIDTDDEGTLYLLAHDFYYLWRRYPNRRLDDAIMPTMTRLDPDHYDPEAEAEACTADQYVSFVWDTDDECARQAFESINHYWENGAGTDELKAVQVFDRPHSLIDHDLTYEKNLFALLERLIEYLDSIDQTTPDNDQPNG